MSSRTEPDDDVDDVTSLDDDVDDVTSFSAPAAVSARWNMRGNTHSSNIHVGRQYSEDTCNQLVVHYDVLNTVNIGFLCGVSLSCRLFPIPRGSQIFHVWVGGVTL